MFYRAKLVINPDIKILGLMGAPATHYIHENFGELNSTSQQVDKDNMTVIQSYNKHCYELYGSEAHLAPWLNKNSLKTAPSLNWYQGHIEAGIAQITPKTSGLFLPHDLSLDKTDLIDFNKGCYSGQEIIARMHYRGTPKRAGFVVRWLGTPAQPGDIIYNAQEKKAGVIINSIRLENQDNIAFCSLNHQQLEDQLIIQQQKLQLQQQPNISS